MWALLVASTVFATILTAMAFGVLLGYTVILGILRLFGHRQQAALPAASPTLVPASNTSGD